MKSKTTKKAARKTAGKASGAARARKPAATAPAQPARLSRADQKVRRTEELLDAAWAIFNQKGYEDVTIDDVAEHAGVSRYPVYYAFGDKQNLFLELWKKKVSGMLSTIEPHVVRGAALRFNLQAMARLTVEDHSANPYGLDSLYFVVQTIGLSRPEIAESLAVVTTSVVDYVAGIIGSSTIEPGWELRASPRTVAAQVVALINGLSNIRFQTHLIKLKQADLVEAFVTLSMRRTGG